MAVYTGEFRDLEAVAALTVATVAEADDPAILERLVSALVAAGFEQEDAWAPLSLEKPLEPPPPGPPRYHLLVPRSLRSSPDSSSQANFLRLLPAKAVFERLAEVEPAPWWRVRELADGQEGYLHAGPGVAAAV